MDGSKASNNATGDFRMGQSKKQKQLLYTV